LFEKQISRSDAKAQRLPDSKLVFFVPLRRCVRLLLLKYQNEPGS